MNSEWVTTKLGEVCQVTKGVTYRGEHVGTGGDGLVSITSIRPGGGFLIEGVRAFAGPRKPHHELEPGDIVIALTDLTQTGNLIGSPARVAPTSFDRLVASHHVARVRPRNGLDKGFAYYRLLAPDFNAFAATYATGTTVRQVRPADLDNFDLDLPSVSEQRRIASILGALDDKIEHNRVMAGRLNDLCRLAYKHLASQRDRGRWSRKPIGDCVSVVGGSTPSTKQPGFWGGEIAFATPKDLAGLDVPVLTETERTITSEGVSQISSGVLRPGTVLLSSRAPIGYLAIAHVPVAVNQGFIAMVCDGPLPNHYVLRWAEASLDEIVSQANGSTFLEISKRDFRPILVPVPTTEALEGFLATAAPAHELMTALLTETRALSTIRGAILPRLVSGKIRVPESYDPA